MKLAYKKIDKGPERAFLARRDTLLCLEDNWHFHEEFELIYFLKSKGTRYVGNSIGNFEEGELYFIGSNVPHLFRNTREYYISESGEENVDLIVVQFPGTFLGSDYLDIHDFKKIKLLFSNSARGLKFTKLTTSLLYDMLLGLVYNLEFSGLINLLKVLDILSVSDDCEFLCTEGVSNYVRKNEKERMANVINFLNDNYEHKIELEEISEVANMSPSAFCRFFKKRTQKSFSQYLNEIRIGSACKHLIEGRIPISEVSFISGFNSLTNFNRQFKFHVGVTPREYMKQYNKKD